jgi:predicted amidohydrolase YtcJ
MFQPDLVLYNGVIRTLDPAQPRAGAVAIWRERILALGDDELRRLVPPARALDLGGRLVLPGFTDSHIHFVEYALRRRRVDLSGATSLEAAQARVREAAEGTPAGQWVLGGGWDRNAWPDPRFPAKEALDAISRRHPIALDSKDVHTLWVNSLALARAGIDAATPDPPGGAILRRPADGDATGILSEMPAKALVWRVVGRPAPAFLRGALREAIATLWQAGVTGIHDCEDAAALAAFQELRRRDELGLRVLMHLDAGNLEAAISSGIRSGLGDPWVRIGGVKLFMDGALGSRTAQMLEPYDGEPANLGTVVTGRAQLVEMLRRALPAGISAAIHAIGDAANRTVLDVFEELLPRYPQEPALRHRIEHVQLLAVSDIPRLARLGLIASVQPLHATSDYPMVERYWAGRRSEGAYAFKSLLDAGARLVFGSDCPVEPCDPLGSLYAATARRRADGSPGAAGWHPGERLTLEQAVAAQCREPAYAAGAEAELGTLTPGKLADMVILSQDIWDRPAEALLETQVHATVVAGRPVYRSPAWG